MLKRQRPVTPPLPSVPLLADPSSLDSMVMEREYKRRRATSITPLEAPWRDWGHNLQAIVTRVDNSQPPQGEGLHQPTDNEYRSVNTILRELHTLHQHRLLFTTSGTPPTHGFASQPPSKSSHLQTSSTQSKRMSAILSEHANLVSELPCIDEQIHVTEWYEERNRLLGSTLLSRRRELGLDDTRNQ
ncbi:hypothetical protein APHAL10511_006546 [Amanita phalloides]|nr:hypothetical protein APHAL10511_006546 [Amanita phalloides]